MPITSKLITTGDLAAKFKEMSDKADALSEQKHYAQVTCSNCQGTDFRSDDSMGDEGHIFCAKCGTDNGPRGEAIRKAVEKAAYDKLSTVFKP